MSEINDLMKYLHNSKVEDNVDSFTNLINMIENHPKLPIFTLLKNNSSDLSVSFPLIFQLITKLKKSYEDILVIEALKYFKTISDKDILEWVCKCTFLILEFTKDKKKNDQIKLLILENIKHCSQNLSIINYLFNFMLNDGTSDIIYAILEFIPEISDDFIRNSIEQTNQIILKNISHVLTKLSQTHKMLFVNYKHFDVFLDSEFNFLRNCYLEIIFNMVPVFKEIEDIESIKKIIKILEERLNDIHFSVRHRAVSLLGSLFENNSIPLDIRNEVVKSVGDRILDKAVLVRKKAIIICNNLLINNPFITNNSLRKSLKSEKENLQNSEKYYKDMDEFHDIIKDILVKVMTLLNCNVQDNQIFLDFIKLCLYFDIEGSKEYFQECFSLVYESDTIVVCFRDIISRLKQKKISVTSFLKKFVETNFNNSETAKNDLTNTENDISNLNINNTNNIDENPVSCLNNSKSYELILRELYKRGIINIYDELISDILKNKDIYESSYLLFSIGRYVENTTYYNLLKHISEILFSSQSSEDLCYSLKIYCNILKLKLKKKENEESNICSLINKNLIKMTFLDFPVIQETIQFLYKNSTEFWIKSLLVSMSHKNINLLKLIYTVGVVGINHMKYLEMLEKQSKNKKEKINVSVPEEIKERRKSINASRVSIILEEPESEPDRSKIIKDGGPIDINKSEEEISDFFFYLKEKDILYNKEGLLYEFSKMIPEFCNSENPDLEEVSYLALFNLMCISSEYFLEHKDLFLKSFSNKNYKIRANAVIAFGDFLLSYNSLIEGDIKSLFHSLQDSDLSVRKNGLLVIYNLLKRNILRLGSNSVYLTNLIFDAYLGDISRNIIQSLCINDNFITTIVYEKISSSVENYEKYLEFFQPLLKEKSRETIFLKLLRAQVNEEVMKYMYNKFAFGEKFVEDIKHIEEFKKLGTVEK